MSREAVELEASDLQIGEDRYITCTFCGRDNKMGISRVSDGVLYNCFSSACNAKGFVPSHPDYNRKLKTLAPRHRRWIGKPEKSSGADWQYFNDHFDINLADWEVQATHNDEYLFPIRNRQDVRVGEVIRQPTWPGSHRKGQPGRPKAQTFLEEGQPRLSWHTGEGNALVLVEDQVSAEKVRQKTGHTAVALLGNTISAKEAHEIANWTADVVFIWLDADMASQAYLMNAEYGPLFKNSRVVFTEEDPKDLTAEQIIAEIGD
jgi:hypothetical protein